MPTIEDIFNYVSTLRQKIAELGKYNEGAAKRIEDLMKEIDTLNKANKKDK